MAESMTADLWSTRYLQWKHTMVDDCVKTFTKGYKKKKGFRKTASSHGEEDRHSTKTGVLAPWHSVCRMQVTSVVLASTECDAVPKGAIPFYAFAH